MAPSATAASSSTPSPSVVVRPEGQFARGSIDAPAWTVTLVGGTGILFGLGFLGWRWIEWRRTRQRSKPRRLTR